MEGLQFPADAEAIGLELTASVEWNGQLRAKMEKENPICPGRFLFRNDGSNARLVASSICIPPKEKRVGSSQTRRLAHSLERSFHLGRSVFHRYVDLAQSECVLAESS